MPPGQIVRLPTLRERPRKTAALQRRFARAAAPRLSPRLLKALQLLYGAACIATVAVSLAIIAGVRIPTPDDIPVPADGFRTCVQAEAAGAGTLWAFEPGYRESLDSDLDGRGCEWNTPRRAWTRLVPA